MDNYFAPYLYPHTFVDSTILKIVMKKFLINLIVLMTIAATSTAAKTSIHFDVSFREPQAHYAEIKMTIEGIKQEYIDVKLPVWTPGSYLVREYARHVESFSACDKNGKLLDAKKIDKNTWRISSKKLDQVLVNYRLYGYEVSVRTNYFDESHAFLSPAATFMYVDGFLKHPIDVTIVPHERWTKVSTGLDAVAGKDFTFSAPDFDILYDSPIEVGNQDVFSFTAAGVLHEVAMVGGGNYDKQRIIQDFTTIIEESTKIFGVNPNKRYVFIVHHFQSGGGGLEHLNSTVLGATRNGYTNESAYSRFLGLVAHEYFHLWHVKRLRPIELGPFDYTKENYTTALWIMEGFTSYFDNLILLRAGFIPKNSYLGMLTGDVSTVENRSGQLVQPVALASFDAWIKYYRPDENSANSSVSYYNKGALLAWLLDVQILKATNGEKRLDDVLRDGYKKFYVEKGRGFEEPELQALIEEIAGESVDEIFNLAHSTERIDYNKYLNPIGYELINHNEGLEIPNFGARTSVTDGRLIVNSVERESGAWDGGVNVRDELIAVNGTRLDAAGRELNYIVQRSQVGDTLSVLVARDGLVKELAVRLSADIKGSFEIRPLANASAEQRKLATAWLSSPYE